MLERNRWNGNCWNGNCSSAASENASRKRYRRDLHCKRIKRRRSHIHGPAERCRCHRQGTDSRRRRLAGFHHGPRWNPLLSSRVRQIALVEPRTSIARVISRFLARCSLAARFRGEGASRKKWRADLIRFSRAENQPTKDIKIIYFYRPNAYPAQTKRLSCTKLGAEAVQFLTEHFTFLGFGGQNWMLIVVGLIAVFIFFVWKTRDRS